MGDLGLSLQLCFLGVVDLSPHFFLGGVGLSPHLCFFFWGGGELRGSIVLNFVLLLVVVVYFDFFREYFLGKCMFLFFGGSLFIFV